MIHFLIVKIQSKKKREKIKKNPIPIIHYFSIYWFFKNTAWFNIKMCMCKSIFHLFIWSLSWPFRKKNSFYSLLWFVVSKALVTFSSSVCFLWLLLHFPSIFVNISWCSFLSTDWKKMIEGKIPIGITLTTYSCFLAPK